MKPNSLLKVVSILYIIVAAIGLLLAILVAVMGGAVFGSLAESAGFGLAVGGIMGVIMLVGTVITVLLNISAYDSVGAIIATAVAYLVLPVLYVIGAFKGPAAD